MSQRVLSFNYVLRDVSGNVLDSSDQNPLPFIEGAMQILPALEARLLTMKTGEKANVKLKAADAYGVVDPKMMMDVPQKELSHLKLEVGGFLQLQLDTEIKVVRVAKIGAEVVTLDGNHPLAGQDLDFDIELIEIRPATAEEIAHGHAHGPGGHHH